VQIRQGVGGPAPPHRPRRSRPFRPWWFRIFVNNSFYKISCDGVRRGSMSGPNGTASSAPTGRWQRPRRIFLHGGLSHCRKGGLRQSPDLVAPHQGRSRESFDLFACTVLCTGPCPRSWPESFAARPRRTSLAPSPLPLSSPSRTPPLHRRCRYFPEAPRQGKGTKQTFRRIQFGLHAILTSETDDPTPLTMPRLAARLEAEAV